MKRFISILMIVSLLMSLTSLFGCGGDKYEYVELRVKGYDAPIIIALDDTYAPITVKNFLNLVDDGFYDGLTFHRIIPGFMVQGGDPKGDGTGGSEKKIKGEFAANGVTNPTHHARGVISMARSSYNYNGTDLQMDSASSQFFICHKASAHLDGLYAAFGFVVEGMETVDALCQYVEDKPSVLKDTNGGVKKDAQPVIEHIKRIDYQAK